MHDPSGPVSHATAEEWCFALNWQERKVIPTLVMARPEQQGQISCSMSVGVVDVV